MVTFFIYLCVQPAQQHGRRIPPDSLDMALFIRMSRVSAFLPEVTQHIHSLRASGVMSAHSASTLGVAVIAFLKSVGSVCIVPLKFIFVVMCLININYYFK